MKYQKFIKFRRTCRQDTINIDFNGSAGQSFGAFAANGITFKLEGNTNDYLGKGLSGATISVKKPEKADFKAEENIIAGNVCLFGAISGNVYINGIAGERFAVRNSGANAVVEGIGDHGCEYMTGGKVIILGKTGRNFAAGMSGGIAYIYDKDNNFINGLCNTESIEFENLSTEDNIHLKHHITEHVKYTNSSLGKKILSNWRKDCSHFIKVMPTEYKKALENILQQQKITNKL